MMAVRWRSRTASSEARSCGTSRCPRAPSTSSSSKTRHGKASLVLWPCSKMPRNGQANGSEVPQRRRTRRNDDRRTSEPGEGATEGISTGRGGAHGLQCTRTDSLTHRLSRYLAFAGLWSRHDSNTPPLPFLSVAVPRGGASSSSLCFHSFRCVKSRVVMLCKCVAVPFRAAPTVSAINTLHPHSSILLTLSGRYNIAASLLTALIIQKLLDTQTRALRRCVFVARSALTFSAFQTCPPPTPLTPPPSLPTPYPPPPLSPPSPP